MPAELYTNALGQQVANIQLLLINPNCTTAFTDEIADYLTPRLPADVGITFYTPPGDAPKSIDGPTDGVLSTSVVLRDLLQKGTDGESAGVDKVERGYSGVIVSCFSAHPLVPVLKEIFDGRPQAPPVVGIMESSVLAALQLGPTFGIATTGPQWEPLFDEAVRSLGISSGRYTGTKGTGFSAISLHGAGPADALLQASVDLVAKGARVIILGCAGMAPMRASLEADLAKKSGRHVPVIDGVQAAVDAAIGYARMGIGRTFKPASE
ncbi:hypothetical protein L198_01952 [Cryptococcus wingfieldii CBS 7118]|uniref:Asp/Glu/hydantoin racemase n=1 Tax=Cryptococcus wingfieldii CBS 7118 TaxID=1295528 RepID=A0A1E3JWT1_9TREE|nr:hypothetical protein L198_01952 [Cryptococcus wingfieldii CBS 7118]ODO05260.1 hypothetical protein L198_01952 [Cryptococcus wingfieldii CBS 7118]